MTQSMSNQWSLPNIWKATRLLKLRFMSVRKLEHVSYVCVYKRHWKTYEFCIVLRFSNLEQLEALFSTECNEGKERRWVGGMWMVRRALLVSQSVSHWARSQSSHRLSLSAFGVGYVLRVRPSEQLVLRGFKFRRGTRLESTRFQIVAQIRICKWVVLVSIHLSRSLLNCLFNVIIVRPSFTNALTFSISFLSVKTMHSMHSKTKVLKGSWFSSKRVWTRPNSILGTREKQKTNKERILCLTGICIHYSLYPKKILYPRFTQRSEFSFF